ncbi:thioredoxin family protein [Pseudomonas mucidolens]|uniref:thioredoxin family protein n=1 Tax=Pseudomonas mucidolens TaxID=46679 RepID=UPI0030DA9781
MSLINTVLEDATAYSKALETPRTVFMLFVSPHCPACGAAKPLFSKVAARYRRQAAFYLLDTTQTPRHPEVTGTPTLLILKNGKLVERLKGFGPWETQEQTLKRTFARHTRRVPTKRAKRT